MRAAAPACAPTRARRCTACAQRLKFAALQSARMVATLHAGTTHTQAYLCDMQAGTCDHACWAVLGSFHSSAVCAPSTFALPYLSTCWHMQRC